MATHLFVCGHGAGDPGAGGNGINERDFTRNEFRRAITKYANQLKKNKIVWYDAAKNLYYDTANGWGLYSMNRNSYASVTEWHLDAASPSATGGHVIINSAFGPDGADLKCGQAIKNIVGLWGSVKNTGGVNKRNNLLNCNVAANRGITYRLIELGFITSNKDVTTIKRELDQYAKQLVEAVTGEKLGGTTVAKNEYWTQTGWYEMLVDDTFYTNPSFSDKTKSGWKLAKGSRFYVDGVVDNPSKTAKRGMVLSLGSAGKRYMTLNKKLVKKV